MWHLYFRAGQRYRLTIFCLCALLYSCITEPCQSGNAQASRGTSSKSHWLVGDTEERFAMVAKQLRGFDVAMAEISYRYGELYWAGQDSNWGYADYQIEHIQVALRDAIQRRPARAPNARMLDAPLENLILSVKNKDQEAFATGFKTVTLMCNACHQAEDVGFIGIAPPNVRVTPVVAP